MSRFDALDSHTDAPVATASLRHSKRYQQLWKRSGDGGAMSGDRKPKPKTVTSGSESVTWNEVAA